MEKIVSVVGLFSMVGFAWLLSSHRSKIPWRIVGGGLFLQFALALLVLKTTPGQMLFDQMGKVFNSLLDCVDVGSQQVFGATYTDHFVAFKVLPTIIFFSSLLSMLYYLGRECVDTKMS